MGKEERVGKKVDLDEFISEEALKTMPSIFDNGGYEIIPSAKCASPFATSIWHCERIKAGGGMVGFWKEEKK